MRGARQQSDNDETLELCLQPFDRLRAGRSKSPGRSPLVSSASVIGTSCGVPPPRATLRGHTHPLWVQTGKYLPAALMCGMIPRSLVGGWPMAVFLISADTSLSPARLAASRRRFARRLRAGLVEFQTLRGVPDGSAPSRHVMQACGAPSSPLTIRTRWHASLDGRVPGQYESVHQGRR